jgi:hypothetical protein
MGYSDEFVDAFTCPICGKQRKIGFQSKDLDGMGYYAVGSEVDSYMILNDIKLNVEASDCHLCKSDWVEIRVKGQVHIQNQIFTGVEGIQIYKKIIADSVVKGKECWEVKFGNVTTFVYDDEINTNTGHLIHLGD